MSHEVCDSANGDEVLGVGGGGVFLCGDVKESEGVVSITMSDEESGKINTESDAIFYVTSTDLEEVVCIFFVVCFFWVALPLDESEDFGSGELFAGIAGRFCGDFGNELF